MSRLPCRLHRVADNRLAITPVAARLPPRHGIGGRPPAAGKKRRRRRIGVGPDDSDSEDDVRKQQSDESELGSSDLEVFEIERRLRVSWPSRLPSTTRSRLTRPGFTGSSAAPSGEQRSLASGGQAPNACGSGAPACAPIAGAAGCTARPCPSSPGARSRCRVRAPQTEASAGAASGGTGDHGAAAARPPGTVILLGMRRGGGDVSRLAVSGSEIS